MAEPFIGQLMVVAFNFAPKGWAYCDGQLMPIAQNQSLYSLIGTIYGGDGVTTYALPDLRGRVAMHQGKGPGLTNRVIGQELGAEDITLTTSEIPGHSHTGSGTTRVVGYAATQLSPVNHYLAVENSTGTAVYHQGPSTDLMAADNVNVQTNNTGGGGSHLNIQPSLALTYIISEFGLYPSRN